MDTPPQAEHPGSSSPPPPPPFGSPRPRQLRRRPDRGPLAGVCAGVAEHFNVDPVIVRIAMVVLALTGPGVVAYVLAWIFVPAADDDVDPPTSRRPNDRTDHGAQVFGIVLLAIAVSALWGDWWSPARRWMLPFGLMALGAWLLLRGDGDADLDAAPPAPVPPSSPAATSTTAPPATSAPVDASSTPRATTDAPPVWPDTSGDPSHTASWSTPPWSDATVADATVADTTATVPGGPPGATALAEAPPFGDGTGRRRRRMLGPIVMGTLLIWSGTAWMTGTSVETALAVALCILGVGFVLGAFVGGSWGLVVPAIGIGAALIVASTVDIPLSGPIGDRTWAPEARSAVEDRYELSIGEGTLDLTGVTLQADDHLAVEAAVGIGHLVIEVPEGPTVIVSADVAAGEAVVFGHPDSGMGVSTERTVRRRGDEGTIELDLQVGFGQIEVRRTGAAPILTPR